MRATSILLILIFAPFTISLPTLPTPEVDRRGVVVAVSPIEKLYQECLTGFKTAREKSNLQPLKYEKEMEATLDKKYQQPNCPKSKPADENGYTVLTRNDIEIGIKLVDDPKTSHVACSKPCAVGAFKSAGSPITILASIIFVLIFVL